MNRAILLLLMLTLSLAPALCWAAEPRVEEAKAIAEIERLGGKVTRDEKSPGKQPISAGLAGTKVSDTGLASTKGLSEARSFIAAAAKEVDKIVDDRDREYLMYDLAGMQAMVGDIERAKATASACSISGRRSETYRYIGELQGALADKAGAITTLVLARKAELAALSSNKKERGWLGIGLLAIDQARIGDFQGASETLQLIEDAKSREEYQTSIAHFQTAQDARRAVNHIKDPFQRDLAVKDIVDAEASSGKMAAAWASAKDIVDLGLRTSAYITIAEAEGNANDAKRAYGHAIKTAEQLRGNGKSDALTIPSLGDTEFHEIAASQARSGDINGAKATAALVRDPSEKAASFIDIARAQLKASDRQGARVTLTNAVKVRTAATYGCDFMQQLAAVLVEAGDLPEAMKTVSIMDQQGESKDHAYEEIIDVLLDEHKLKQARETVAFISDPRWKARTLARIAAAESSAGEIATARKTFAEARSITATVPATNRESWTWDRSSVYHDVAMRQAETGDFDEIKRWIPLVKEPRDRVSSWLGAAWPLAHRYYDESQKQMVRKAEQGAPTRP